jgi:GH15 family glucan-1,4-alpha-glucosidase
MMRIDDYALLGDCETAALVGRNGSIDWLCWPHFASEACFASLLGTEENGFWRLAPKNKVTKSFRRYVEHTLILETTYETRSGTVQVLDFMPPRENHSHIVRLVKGVRGTVKIHSEIALRFSYGQTVPWVTRTESGIRAVAGPDTVELHTSAPLKGRNLRTVSDFVIQEGQTVSFTLTYGTFGAYRDEKPLEAIDVNQAYQNTVAFWRRWASRCSYEGPYRELVERSFITLKALTFLPTGAIVAAPTTSLPEDIGGVRNWDYRYCWLRDTTFALLAFMNGGYYEEARDWMHWLRRTVAGSADQIQIMYGISGERTLTEFELATLRGYEKSSPVRVGNAAAKQLQLDIYGEVLDAFLWCFGGLGDERLGDFEMLCSLVEHLGTVWQQSGTGIWEVRGNAKHFTYSKVMAWVAFDRAIKIAERRKLPAPLKAWKKTRTAIHAQVCEKAFNRKMNSFVQRYGSRQLDASALLIAMVGFLPPEDPRIVGTIEAIERDLMQDGLVKRYDTSKASDGLPGGEGRFLACSFWLVSNLKLIGREADAVKLFEQLLSLANDVGLLSEEYDTKRNSLVGNFPQALSHIALIGAAFQLARLEKAQRHIGIPDP